MNIVCLHSSQSHGGQWRALKRMLGPRQDVLAPDLIGYGKGPKLSEPATEFRLGHELEALARQDFTRYEQVALVGHSYGAALALKWAREFPRQVAGLVLYEPVAFHVLPPTSEGRLEVEKVAAKMTELSVAEAAAAFVDYWNEPGYFARLPGSVQDLMIRQQPKVAADFNALLHEPVRALDYQDIACPVLLMHGERSPASSRAVADELAENLPHVERASVAAGHMAPLNEPGKVNPLFQSGLERFGLLGQA